MIPLSIMFIPGSVLLGAGALLAPALPGKQVRIGLGAALALAVIMCGATGWDDALRLGTRWSSTICFFALVTLVLLGGTLGRGQLRAARQGAEVADADMGWPAALDLAFFALVAALFALPTLILPVPLDTDAQGFGYLALMTRLGGSLGTLAPFHPEISYLYAPGFPLLVAWLSSQLGQPLHQVQFALAAVLGLLNVWVAHDLGSELGGRRLGRALALALTGGLGLFLAFMDSHFTTLLALVFAQGFVLCALRYQRDGQRTDLFAAALLLAAVVLSHPDTTIILALGFGPWLITMWSGEPRPSLRRWLLLFGRRAAAGPCSSSAPGCCAVCRCWAGDIVSPLRPRPGSRAGDARLSRPVELAAGAAWRAHGAAPARAGDAAGARLAVVSARTSPSSVSANASPPGCRSFATTILSASPGTARSYRSVCWRGRACCACGNGLRRAGQSSNGAGRAWALLTAAFVLALLALALQLQLLTLSKGHFGIHGAFASHADVAAMTWLRENTPETARVLNFPGSALDSSWEGDWAAVISERDNVYYRWQPFFRGNETSVAEQERLRNFWLDPVKAGACATAGRDWHRLRAGATDRSCAGEFRPGPGAGTNPTPGRCPWPRPWRTPHG